MGGFHFTGFHPDFTRFGQLDGLAWTAAALWDGWCEYVENESKRASFYRNAEHV